MSETESLDVIKLFKDTLGEKINDFILPPPSYELMQCKILEFNPEQKSIVVKVAILDKFLNPYGTLQGGLILGAIDNAVGPLSMLIAPKNVTRNIESKLIKPITLDVEHIYVSVTLFEHKKRRLIFDAIVRDKEKTIYAKARLTNWIL